MNLYINYYSADFLTEVSLDTLIRVRAIDLTPGDWTVDTRVIGDSLYFTRDVADPGGQVVKVNLLTFSEVARLTLDATLPGAGNGYPHSCLENDDTYLYFVLSVGATRAVVRIALATFTYVDKLAIPLARPWPIRNGNTLYLPHNRTPGSVTRIDLPTFTNTGNVGLTRTDPTCACIEDNFMYIGHDRFPAAVTKFNLTTFAEDSFIDLLVGENACFSIVSDGTYLYCGLASSIGNPGVIVRVDIATFTRVDSLTLPLVVPWASAERDIWNLYIYNNQLWALCESSPTNVVQIDIPTFTRVAGLQLDPAEFDSWSGALWEIGVVDPTVATNAASNIEAMAATLNGILTADGGEACDCGFEWGESEAELIHTTPTQSKVTGESFSRNIQGLRAGRKYYFRAKATNSA